MNISCLFFDQDGHVCFAEVLTVPNLPEALRLAQETLNLRPSFSWYELWLDGERVASSHDGGAKPAAPPKPRGLLH